MTIRTTYEIAEHLFINVQPVSSKTVKETKPVEVAVNHIAVIDCSGSMWQDLPRVREQLKKKLPKLLGEKDTISIVWFSGRGEFGTLLEAEPVATLKDLQTVERAIDRWLKPVGMTGFKEPLEEVERLVDRVSKKNKATFSLFFMSDGCDNQWPRADITKTIEKVAGRLASTTIVEYGYYADRQLLAQMTVKAGGTHIFAQDFDAYEPTFAKAMSNRPLGAKRIEISVGDAIEGIAFALSDGDILTFDASTGKVTVPEDLAEVAYLTSYCPKSADNDEDGALPPRVVGLLYAALSLFAVRMKPEITYAILKHTGDVAFIDRLGGCFGKQRYSEFAEAAKQAAFDPKQRLVTGCDRNRVPPDNAFTVLDLLNILASDDKNRVMLDDPSFKYSRISRGRESADESLNTEEQAQIDALTEEMAKAKKNAKKLKELQAKMQEILDKKKDALKFVADPAPDGYPVSALTYNEERPNISMLIRKTGHVDLTSHCPSEYQSKLPQKFPTAIFRNYCVVKDGLVNIDKLPVVVTYETMQKLERAGASGHATGLDDPTTKILFVIDLAKLPVINRRMVKKVSAKKLFELEWELTKRRAEQKVLSHYKKELIKVVPETFLALYGKDATDWLKERGITERGFAPRMVQAESKDFYIAKEMKVHLKGYDTLPSIKDVTERTAKGKTLSGCAELMAGTMEEVKQFFDKNVKTVHEKWLNGKTDVAQATTRGLIRQTAEIRFGVIVGQTWFDEWKSLDECEMDLKLNGETVKGKVELREVEVHI